MATSDILSGLKMSIDNTIKLRDDIDKSNLTKEQLRELADHIISKSKHTNTIDIPEKLQLPATNTEDILQHIVFAWNQRISSSNEILVDFIKMWSGGPTEQRAQLYLKLFVLEAYWNHHSKTPKKNDDENNEQMKNSDDKEQLENADGKRQSTDASNKEQLKNSDDKTKNSGDVGQTKKTKSSNAEEKQKKTKNFEAKEQTNMVHSKEQTENFDVIKIINKYRSLLSEEDDSATELNLMEDLEKLSEDLKRAHITPSNVMKVCDRFLGKQKYITSPVELDVDGFEKPAFIGKYFFHHKNNIVWQKKCTLDYWNKDFTLRKCLIADMFFDNCFRAFIKPRLEGKAGRLKLCPHIYAKCGTKDKWCWKKMNMTKNEIVEENLPDWITNATNLPTKAQKHLEECTIFQNESDASDQDYTKVPCVIYGFFVHNTHYLKRARAVQPNAVQTYIGEAKHGVKDRWIENGRSHCNEARRMFNETSNLQEYLTQLNTIQLVDEYLAMAHIFDFEMAVILLSNQVPGNVLDEERETIKKFQANEMIFGLNKQCKPDAKNKPKTKARETNSTCKENASEEKSSENSGVDNEEVGLTDAKETNEHSKTETILMEIKTETHLDDHNAEINSKVNMKKKKSKSKTKIED